MSTTTYSTETQPRVGAALGELVAALKHLVLALLTSISTPVTASAALAKRAKEAAEARKIADRFARTDSRMAGDLYSAADRHELGE